MILAISVETARTFTTITPAVAVVIALLFNAYQMRQLRSEKADRAEDRAISNETRARDQASRVSAWIEVTAPEIGAPDIVGTAYLTNQSHEPVYDVAVEYEALDEASLIYSMPLRDTVDFDIRTWRRSAVPGGKTLEDRTMPVRYTGPIPHGEKPEPMIVPLRISFRDAAGAWWLRDTSGVLHRWQPEAVQP